MTCREFKQAAESLSLWELARPANQRAFDHAAECAGCAVWLNEQQMLAAGVQALQARTAGREAGPHVEQVLLRAFRNHAFEVGKTAAVRRSAPVAFRMSRFFQVGAYGAAAAAIAVGLFLGVRLLERRSATGPVRSQLSQPATVPVQQGQTVENMARQEEAPVMRERPATPVERETVARAVSRGSGTKRSVAASGSQAGDDSDFVALMFCDPLICSSDTQVVRMELPVAGASDRDTQTEVADVVVGDDGLVRAVRIVN